MFLRVIRVGGMSVRNPELELIRFIFCLLIVLHHADNFLDYHMNGWHAVGFFFILSGFFLPNILNNKSNFLIQTGRLLFRRWKRIYPSFVISVALGLTAWSLMRMAKGPLWWKIQHIWPELLWLQMVGYWPQRWWITGVSWFLSAWWIGLACIAPVVCLSSPKRAKWILGGIFLIGCVFIYQLPGGFSTPGEFWIFPLHQGLLLGITGISLGGALGCWYYNDLRKLPCPPIANFRWGIFLLAVLWMFGKGGALVTWLLSALGILLSVWRMQKTAVKWLSKPWVYFCGDWSMFLFLNHYYWASGLGQKYTFIRPGVQAALYVGLSVAGSLLVWWVVRRLMPYLMQQTVNLVVKAKKRDSV